MNVHFRLLKKISPFQNFEYPNLSRGPAPDYAQRNGRQDALRPRVNETGGNRSGLTGYRSNRSDPVRVWAGIKPAPIQNSNLNSKK